MLVLCLKGKELSIPLAVILAPPLLQRYSVLLASGRNT